MNIGKKLLSIALCLMLLLGTLAVGTGGFAELLDAISIKASAAYSVGDTIYYGTYPQSEVTDTTTISVLNTKAVALSAVGNGWQSYNYYSGTGTWADGQMTASDYMRYIDVELNDQKYRGVIFDTYRPYRTGFTSSASDTYQDDNGYTYGNVYWFKYEPLEWRVLDPSTGLVMCETIIDSQPYNNYILYADNDEFWGDSAKTYYANNYANSSIRQWLNDDFYNTAFSDEQKSNIKTTTLNNDGYYTLTGQTGYEDYDSASTNDKIFLLSYDEVLNSNYGFSTSCLTYDSARLAKGSDYAKCQGLWVSNSSGYSYDGCSYWRLRSPGYTSSSTCSVYYEGCVNHPHYYYYGTYFAYYGVRPALKIQNLKSDYAGSETGDSADTIKTPHGTFGFDKNLEYFANNTSSTAYNPELSYMLMTLADCAYNSNTNDIRTSLHNLGFEDDDIYISPIYGIPADFEYLAAYYIARKNVDGKEIVLIGVRGTGNALHGLDELTEGKLPVMGEWYSDIFETGAGVPFFGTGTNWHQGYKNSAENIWSALEQLVYKDSQIPKSNVKYFVTGHSRGAGVANLFSIKLDQYGVSKENVFDYNFACPDTARDYISSWNTGNHDNMFNICNCQDIIVYLPGILLKGGTQTTLSWGKYGVTKFFSFDWNDPGYTVLDINGSSYYAHDQKVYLAYLREKHDWNEFKDYYAMKVSRAGAYLSLISEGIGNVFEALDCISIMKIFCPVDVKVTDDDGNVLATIINNKATHYVDGIWAFADGDKKAVVLFDNSHINLELTATDSGQMNYTVSQYSFIEDSELGEKSFNNVKLESAKTMLSDIGNATAVKDVDLKVVDDSGTITATVNADGTETPVIDAKLNAKSSTTVDYRSKVNITATASGVPDGYFLAIYSGNNLLEKGTKDKVTYTPKDSNNKPIELKSDTTYTVKVIDSKNTVQKDSNGKDLAANVEIKVKQGFFDKLIAFFKGLFGLLPTVEIKP